MSVGISKGIMANNVASVSRSTSECAERLTCTPHPVEARHKGSDKSRDSQVTCQLPWVVPIPR